MDNLTQYSNASGATWWPNLSLMQVALPGDQVSVKLMQLALPSGQVSNSCGAKMELIQVLVAKPATNKVNSILGLNSMGPLCLQQCLVCYYPVLDMMQKICPVHDIQCGVYVKLCIHEVYSKETKSVMAVWQLNSSIGGFHRLSERPFCEHFYHLPLGVCQLSCTKCMNTFKNINNKYQMQV